MNYLKFLVLLLAMFGYQFGSAQRLELYTNDEKLSAGNSFLTVLSFVPASILMISNHEIGHTTFAKISGDKNASFKLSGKLEDGSDCIGCAFIDYTNFSRAEKAFVPTGGFIFSQALAFASNKALMNIPMSKGLQRAVSMTYILSKFDMSLQVLQGILRTSQFDKIARTGNPSGTDMVSFAYYASNGNRPAFNWINVAAVVFAGLDIYLSRKAISRNWKILMNKNYYRRP